jgi:hypothetical protein
MVKPTKAAPYIATRPPEGVDPNAPDGMLRVTVATMMPGVDPEVEIATMALQATAPELYEALQWALEWIDAVPKEVAAALPPMPGFSRDHVEQVMAKARNEIAQVD